MTNTKFRKKALLSSVAMLLVALVALGSATFAWFTASFEVKAAGVTLRSNAQDGLLIKAASGNQEFAASTTLGLVTNTDELTASETPYVPGSFNLTALSYAQNCHVAPEAVTTPTFYTTSSDKADASRSGKAVVTSASASFSEVVYLKSVSGTNSVYLSSVTITPAQTSNVNNNDNLYKAVRVLVVDKDGKVLAHVGPDGATANTYLNNSAAAADGAESVRQSAYSFITPSQANSTLTSAVTTDNSANYVTVYVYLDGEDDKVMNINSTAAVDVISGIELTFNKVS